jgi:two-component system sensor histidine kinase QseC
MRLLPSSLQRRVLVLLLGLVSVAWLAAAAVNSMYSMRTLDELLDRHLEQAAAVLVARQVGDVDDPPEIGTLLEGSRADRVAFQVWHEGKLALRSTNAPTEPMSSAAAGFENQRILGNEWRVYATSVRDELRIFVGERVGVRDQILYTVVRSALWTLSIALPLVALAGWWSVRTGLAPLRQLGRAIERRGPESLEAIRLNEPLAELQPVVGALNHLLERIAHLLESERRFTADAAHELRTPIASIRIQAEVARGATDPSERMRALEQTLAGCDHARRLVEQLLTMARLEAAPAPDRAPFDLTALVREVAAQIAPTALGRRQSLALEAAAPQTVRGESTLIGLLVRNLLDNAVRYSPEGGTIRVTLARQDACVCLAVEDSGPGLSDEQRSRLGERFFRMLGTDQSGSGLGWSIVRWIARMHELQVTTGVSRDLGGLLVSVRWPAESPQAPA